MGFIKFLLVTFLIIYLIRLVAPFVLRWVFKAFFKKMTQNGGQFYKSSGPNPFGYNQQRQQQQQQRHQSKGDVRIDYVPEQPQDKKDFRGGQYVDYEEVK